MHHQQLWRVVRAYSRADFVKDIQTDRKKVLQASHLLRDSVLRVQVLPARYEDQIVLPRLQPQS